MQFKLTSPQPDAPRRYRNAVLIYNPKAGRRRWRRPKQIRAVVEALERSGMAVSAWPTPNPGAGTELARQAVQAGVDLIVVCGGDGTINEVVRGMAQSQVALAILPGGTANGLARELGLPLEIPAAARAILSSAPRRVSLGRAGDRFFILMAGAGLDGQVLYKLGWRWKQWFGIASYVFETLRQALFRRLTPFVISTGRQRHQVSFAIVSKSQHYGPFRMVREADLFSDRFCVYGFHSERGLRYLLYALAVLTGRSAAVYDISRFPAQKVCCEPIPSERKKVYFQVDGELAGTLPCTMEIVPDALTLLVPTQRLGAETGRR